MVFLRGKVLVIGDTCVGKSSLCQVLSSDGGIYPKNYSSTIMTELIIKQVQLTENNDTVELFLYDSSGKAIYFENCKETWLNADMIVLVFDLSNKESFGHVKFWYEKAKETFLYDKPIIGCVIGNKSDLSSVVNQANIKQMSDSMNMKYFECSAKENQNVMDPFKYLASEYVKKYNENIKKFKQIIE
ncbi:unnamed protein product [Brachionus calyciflorus]|uniref:Uncharacterized protein n=1 Tax=Brachionus calyciflorus TaxID=104777 RepID=A0A814IXG2_9BILA|nr:unnamed protein product [Brachionus calyciflorus]